MTERGPNSASPLTDAKLEDRTVGAGAVLRQAGSARPAGMTLSDALQVNSLVWIRSLADRELGPSRRMAEDLAMIATADEKDFRELVVTDRATLLSTLAGVAADARRGFRPILHFDCHGSRDQGLLLEPSGEFLSWGDLADALRRVNVATSNNLCCVFGVCFGLRMSFELSLSKPSPYYLTIAPENEIAVGVLEDRVAWFYRDTLTGGNITAAYQRVLAPDLKLFHCKEIMARALATYIAKNCVGRGRRERRERMVTRTMGAKGIAEPTPEQLSEARAGIRTALEPSQALIDRYAPRFLIGRDPGFGYAELKRLSDGYVALFRKRLELESRKAGR